MDICRGSLVYSRAGRDKGGLFLVLSVKDGYAYLADGDLRQVLKPKKKKLRHLNKTNTVINAEFDNISNAEVRKLLAENSNKYVGR